MTDNPDFNSQLTATDADWADVPSHTNQPISGENANIVHSFTGENDHSYHFRVQVRDNAGNGSIWIESTETTIKIDTILPVASDVSDTT